ncbi:hypothetical protein KCH_49440 [Kitasatospora cheerisanensis KCTC 2395]|uniref:Uncharacterized protein n=1 Tax=Kitasatospora cheerisanensis KCTC 2395 TaxID=1348663 RepID=A0A066YQD0_9ACTN|nr:hypothetical protein KCH_49440 [Kitasatospora cheerisanensis KCTC 2395]
MLQLDGYTLSTDTWFKTEAECIGFIQAHILGQPLLDT